MPSLGGAALPGDGNQECEPGEKTGEGALPGGHGTSWRWKPAVRTRANLTGMFVHAVSCGVDGFWELIVARLFCGQFNCVKMPPLFSVGSTQWSLQYTVGVVLMSRGVLGASLSGLACRMHKRGDCRTANDRKHM